MAFISATVAAIGTFIGGLTWASVGTFLLKTVASIGLSALAQKLSGQKKTGPAPFGVKGQLERGADLPQTFVMGKYATAGSLTYANTFGDGANQLAMVITLSDLPLNGLNGLWVNGAKVTLSEGTNYYYSGQWLKADEYTIPATTPMGLTPFRPEQNYILARFYDGTQTVADDHILNRASSTERPWDANSIGKGKAYAVMQMGTSREFFSNGFPSFLFEVEGISLYDPSKDTTVGGSGTHRWDDPTTWESSENPAVQLYNVLRGIRYEGEWFYGLQDVSSAQLPVAHWISQINKCASTIEGASGPEPMFRSSAEVPVNAAVTDVVDSLLDACNGRLSDAGGVYKLFAGAPEAPVMSFTDDDIISTSEQSFTPFLGLADTVNGVAASYPAPAATWQTETAPPIYRPDYEAEDGGRRLMVDVALDFVPYPEQVQRLMKSALNEARRARRHTFTLPPKFWVLEPGDVVSWVSERNGYDAKHFRVDGVIDLGNADVMVDLTEVDGSDYDFDTATDFVAPAIPGILPQPIDPFQVPGFTASAAAITDADDIQRRPAILVQWSPDIDGVASVTIEVRVKATGALSDPARSDTPSDGALYVSGGILPNTTYEVRAQFVPIEPRPTQWSPWFTVTTPDVRIKQSDISQEVVDNIQAIADAASIPTFTTLPTAGDKDGQLVLKMPEAVIYRWDDSSLEWKPAVESDSIAAGAIIASKIGAGEVTTIALAAQAVRADNMKIDGRLELDDETAGLSVGKVGAYDNGTEGIYFGRTLEPDGAAGFGLSTSKVDVVTGLTQSLQATVQTGLRITNANFLRDLAIKSDPVPYIATQVVDLDPGVRSIDLALLGAGGGGASGRNDGTHGDGQPGGDTIIRLLDGATEIISWTANGGDGGAGLRYGNATAGQSSPWGTGGNGGTYRYSTSAGGGESGGGTVTYPGTAGSDATGYGAGGGGGGDDGPFAYSGRGGLAGQYLTIAGFDVSGLADPKLEITIGAAGVGDTVGHADGGDGSPGRVEVTQDINTPIPADVIPLSPSATGTMSTHGPFPDLGPGFWVLSAIGTNYVNFAGLEINDSGVVISTPYDSHITFVSSKTPVVTSTAYAARTINYQFFKMGA